MKKNVVRVVATLSKSGEEQGGYGFIVAELDNELYIVTANHVVRPNFPEEVDHAPKVFFFNDKGTEYKSQLLDTFLQNNRGDIAVLRVKLPPRVPWEPASLSPVVAKRGGKVSYIGRFGDWYVPAQPGVINEIDLEQMIRVDNLNVSPGTAGAPLIGEKGILGMIVDDGQISISATPIDTIKQAFSKWDYPWQLTTKP